MTQQNAIVGVTDRHELYVQTLTDAQVDFLLQRTPKEEIKSRPGKGGKDFSYVDISYVIERLNLVFGFTWDFEVKERMGTDYEVGVLGRLTVTTPTGQVITKEQFGQSDIKKDRQGAVLSLIDDYKGAASDSLKKCASLLGIGLDVYGGEAVPEPARNPNMRVVEGEIHDGRAPGPEKYPPQKLLREADDVLPSAASLRARYDNAKAYATKHKKEPLLQGIWREQVQEGKGWDDLAPAAQVRLVSDYEAALEL